MLEELLHKYGVKTTVEWANTNPNMKDNGHMNHFKVLFTIKDDSTRQMTVYFSKGKALTEEPTATEVIDCLIQDMNSISEGLDEFVDSMGYEYHEGKKVFDTIETQTQKLWNFLGFEKFQEVKALYESDEV
ncbi:hypothetical protein [Caudoviricetes sp.]|nr:hypothetical protein [Caudoviricetes sp.]